jgi:hypothetical protein
MTHALPLRLLCGAIHPTIGRAAAEVRGVEWRRLYCRRHWRSLEEVATVAGRWGRSLCGVAGVGERYDGVEVEPRGGGGKALEPFV